MTRQERKATATQTVRKRSFLAFVALATIIGSAGIRASANIIGWWGFEGVPGQTAGIGTVFTNRVDASRLPAEVYARYNGTASTDYQPVFDNPVFSPPYNAMGDSVTSVGSRSTLRFTNSLTDDGRSQGCPVRIQDVDGALDLQTFSLEGWFKLDPNPEGVNPGWRALFTKGYGVKTGGISTYAYTYALYVDDLSSRIKAFFSVRDKDGNLQYLESAIFTGGAEQKQLRDGNWHYVSLVVNGEMQRANLFVDFDDVGIPRWIGYVELGGELVYNSEEPLVIGGNNLVNWQLTGSVDEVRFSDTIVNSADAVLNQRGIPDGTVIGHFPMEGDFKSTVWTNYWTDPVLSVATGGETPSFSDREREMVYCDKDGVQIGKEIDGKCLALNKGRVQWEASELLRASADSLTVEFFLNAKANENTSWASIVRTDYTGTNSTVYLPWNISYVISGERDVACRVDTDSTLNGAILYAKVPLDGQWHHLALQVWRQTAVYRTSFALYVDYELRAEGAVGGLTVYPAGTHFGFGLSSTPFVGRIDEVRLTKGIIPVDDFLRLEKRRSGMTVIFK